MKSILRKILTRILSIESRLVLRKYKPYVIAVTGSVGKTSTKDAIHAVISTRYHARKSEKSFNSEIGVPLTIIGCPNGWSSPVVWFYNILRGAHLILSTRPYPEYLVLEVGADHPGDIASISKWLKPDIAVLTRMSDVPVHIEYFKNAEEVLAEKMHLAKALSSRGTVVVNADDELFMREVLKIDKKKITFGTARDADINIKNVSIVYDEDSNHLPSGEKITISTTDRESVIEVENIIGNHLSYPFAAAVAVAQVLGIDNIDWIKALYEYETARGRMRLIPGLEGSLLIDDSYNSSPIALHEALRTLDDLTTKGRKIAVLGDMKELGQYSKREHEKVGEQVSHIAHTVVAVGQAARDIAESAIHSNLKKDHVHWFNDSVEAADFLHDFVRVGDVVLVKGSQSMRMERVTKALMKVGLNPADFLVRQEDEWQKR